MTLDFAKPPEQKTQIAAAQVLEMDIIFSRLRAGERLIEDDLMARFKQSRHRIRCAIDILAQRGLAVRRTNKGAHVCSFTHRQILDLYELRNVLQDAAITSMQFPVKSETITRLVILNEAHATATARGDLEEVFHLNNQFHRTVFSCCDNKELCAAIEAQARRTYPIRTNSFRKAGYLANAQKEHHQIIQALKQGEHATLTALIRAHIERPMNDYIAQHMPEAMTP